MQVTVDNGLIGCSIGMVSLARRMVGSLHLLSCFVGTRGAKQGQGASGVNRTAMGPPTTMSTQMLQKLGMQPPGAANGTDAGLSFGSASDQRSAGMGSKRLPGALPRPPPLTIPTDASGVRHARLAIFHVSCCIGKLERRCCMECK